MKTITITEEVDLQKHGLVHIHNLEQALKLLSEVYGVLWTETYYDPYSEQTQKFAKPLAEKMSKANEFLGFKK